MIALGMRVAFLIGGMIAATVVVRTLPFLIWSLCSRRITWSGKLAGAIAFSSLVLLAVARDPEFLAMFGNVALGLGYFLLICALLVVWTLRRRDVPSRIWLGAGLFILFLAVPGVFVRVPGGVFVLMAGWELFFSSFSYALDAQRSERDRSWQQGLFFLLVNPALSYPERGRWVAPGGVQPRGLSRCVSGGVLLLLQAVTTDLPLRLADHCGALLGPYLGFVAGAAAGLARAYFGQAGMATIQLGLLGMSGFHGLERFDRPWLASSPADFWRRWNVYLGLWFRRYVFNPIAYELRRKRTGYEGARTALAVLATFVLAGVAHDAVWFFQGADEGQGVLAFALAGAAIIAFATPWLSTAAAGTRGRANLLFARVLSWQLVLATVWIFAWSARQG